MSKLLTILTSTYNRANELKQLYDSLLRQSNKCFTWFVVDDGSKDETEQTIRSFIQEAKLDIIYQRQENKGKTVALNFAIPQIESELVFIADSDDKLTEDAVETVYKYHQKYSHTIGLCGYSFLRVRPDGTSMVSRPLPGNEFIDTFANCRINRNIVGDMSEVWYTKILREFPFPTFSGEKQIGEDTVWIKISGPYKMVFLNHAIYIGDYLDQGISRNRRLNNINSWPKGCVKRADVFLHADIKLRYKITPMLQYIIYGRFAGYKYSDLWKKCNLKLFMLSLTPAAYILYFIWKKQYKKE